MKDGAVMLRLSFLGIASVALGCGGNEPPTPTNLDVAPIQGRVVKAPSLSEARQGFQTALRPRGGIQEPVPTPPPGVFNKVEYDAPAGRLAAFLSPDPRDGKKHPAIVWITGGDCNTIGDVWTEMPRSNDQTASAFRKAACALIAEKIMHDDGNAGGLSLTSEELNSAFGAR